LGKKTKRQIGKTGEEEGDNSLSIYQTDKEMSKFRHHKNKIEKKTRDELKSEEQIRRKKKKIETETAGQDEKEKH